MPSSIGVNLRVTGHCRQGDRKYMEDYFSVAYQQTEDERDLEYAFFGIYDGHGGAEAAAFAKEHLMETIVKHRCFWSDNDEDVLRAIREGYVATHHAMWQAQEKWPKTTTGLPSTAGTTASVAFIRHGKIYVGHVGDSAIVLGVNCQRQMTTTTVDNDSTAATATMVTSEEWMAKPLTRDHKPENRDEMQRITECGGKVVSKSGVPRVVWNRPKVGHLGPVRRSTPIDEIPFLAVARSLGDLWSYNWDNHQFVVSPTPDCHVVRLDPTIHKCLIFGTDGLFNMLSAQQAVSTVQQIERHNELVTMHAYGGGSSGDSDDGGGGRDAAPTWCNPSKTLVERALERWQTTKLRADNTSVVTLLLDPPGPPKAQVLRDLVVCRHQMATYPPHPPNTEEETDEEEKVEDDNDSDKDNCKCQVVEQLPQTTTTTTTTVLLDTQQRSQDDKHHVTSSDSPPMSSLTAVKVDNNDNSIQINEISSSSNDDSDCCSRDQRRILRSTTSSSSKQVPVATRRSTRCAATATKKVKIGGTVASTPTTIITREHRKLLKTKRSIMKALSKTAAKLMVTNNNNNNNATNLTVKSDKLKVSKGAVTVMRNKHFQRGAHSRSTMKRQPKRQLKGTNPQNQMMMNTRGQSTRIARAAKSK